MNLLIFEPNKGCKNIPLDLKINKINIGKSVKQGYGNILLESDFLPEEVAFISFYKGDFYFRTYGKINITVDNRNLINTSEGIKLVHGSYIKISARSYKEIFMIFIKKDIDNKWTYYNKEKHQEILKVENENKINIINSGENFIFNGEKIEETYFVPKNGNLFCNEKYIFYYLNKNIYISEFVNKHKSSQENISIRENTKMKNYNNQEVAILMKNVCRYDRKKKWYRLKDVNLKISSGRIVAVMGISGAGKSTLFDALLGELKLDSGTISISGDTRGHVPQFSVLRKGNSVEDVMEFYASKKLKGKSKYERDIKINELLGKLNLSFYKKSLVGKLSGGQSRRLDIAVQLLDEPSVILMDEPDSGLDVKSCIELYEILYEITREKNSTILVITHNTNMACKYPYIDNLLFMASQGRICFYGDKDEALDYFNIDDLDEIYKEVENNQDYYVEKYNNSIYRGV